MTTVSQLVLDLFVRFNRLQIRVLVIIITLLITRASGKRAMNISLYIELRYMKH